MTIAKEDPTAKRKPFVVFDGAHAGYGQVRVVCQSDNSFIVERRGKDALGAMTWLPVSSLTDKMNVEGIVRAVIMHTIGLKG